MIQKDQKLEVVEVEQELVENEIENELTEEVYLEKIKEIALSPLDSISELKFPTEQSSVAEQSSRQIANAEKSLNNASNTAMKMGLKGLVALNKVQQQLEQVNASRAVRLNTMNSQAQQESVNGNQYLNLLAIFSFSGLSRMKKAFRKLYGKYSETLSNETLSTETLSKELLSGMENESKFKKLLKKLVRRVKQSQTDS